MRRLISRDVLRVATRKSWVLILRIRPDHLFGVGTIYSARTFCQQFFWKGLFGKHSASLAAGSRIGGASRSESYAMAAINQRRVRTASGSDRIPRNSAKASFSQVTV